MGIIPPPIADALEYECPDALLADGFEDALVGYVRTNGHTVALYDEQKCLDILMARDGMSAEEAVEYFEFNVVAAHMGEHTPSFATFFRPVVVTGLE